MYVIWCIQNKTKQKHMNIDGIIAISGKPGLFKVVTQAANRIIIGRHHYFWSRRRFISW